MGEAELWRWTFLGNELWRYGLFFLLLFGGLLSYRLVSHIFKGRIHRGYAEGEERLRLGLTIFEAFRRSLHLILPILFIWAGLEIFVLPEGVAGLLKNLLLIGAALAVAHLANRLIDLLADYFQEKALRTESRLDEQLVPIAAKTTKVFVWAIAVLLILQNLGYDITSLLAGLGLGGLALAMAARDTLANFFGAVAIFADRPFHVGDTVSVEGFDGTIETIGLRSTRIRTFDGTLVTIPNQMMANAKINNTAKRPTRRTNFIIGVTYNTSYEKLIRALEVLRQILADHHSTAQYRAYFKEFGPSSLNILVNHWCRYLDYEQYLKSLEEINLEIKRRFEEEGIEFAFPTQTIYLHQAGAEAEAKEQLGLGL